MPGAVASNPAGLKLGFLRYLQVEPNRFPINILAVLLVLTSATWGLGFQKIAMFLAAPSLAFSCLVWRNFGVVRRLFFFGNVVPAQVISTSPLSYVCYADMSTGDLEQPAIALKHMIAQGARIPGAGPGHSFACVASYGPPTAQHPERWSDIDPHPASYATTDPRKLEALKASIDPADFAELRRLIQAGRYPALGASSDILFIRQDT